MTKLAYEIVRLLSPVIGFGLASSTVNMQCKKIGILPEQLSSENINEFAIKIEEILQIFAGDHIALEIKQKILNLHES